MKISELIVEVKTIDIDWGAGKGDWNLAKKIGSEIFKAYNVSNNTDQVLKLKTAAHKAREKGSYLGAVLLGLANDYLEKLTDIRD